MKEKDMSQCLLIGSRIREVRTNKGMSQAELAVAANISLPHISDIELGKVEMRLQTFIRIVEALQCSADLLIRPNVPEVKSLYMNEFNELLSGLSPQEMDSIIKIINELKATMNSLKAEQ